MLLIATSCIQIASVTLTAFLGGCSLISRSALHVYTWYRLWGTNLIIIQWHVYWIHLIAWIQWIHSPHVHCLLAVPPQVLATSNYYSILRDTFKLLVLISLLCETQSAAETQERESQRLLSPGRHSYKCTHRLYIL